MAKAKAITRTPATITEMGEAIQEIVDATDPTKEDGEKRNRELWDLQHQYEERIFWTLAQTPEDAMVQVARISAELDAFDYEGKDEDERNANYMRLQRKLDRALYSLMAWIERTHKVAPPEVIDFYMTDRRNPWNYLLAYMPKAEVG